MLFDELHQLRSGKRTYRGHTEQIRICPEAEKNNADCAVDLRQSMIGVADATTGLSGIVWQGVAEAAKRRREILKAYRTKKGKWYAIAYYIRWDRMDRGVGESHNLEEAECKGRDSAVKAARELLRKYADYFSEDATVEVEIRPAIAKGIDL